MSQKSRCWCFTLNNPEKLSDEMRNEIKRRLSAVRYWVIGKEKGESGTPHWQGFVYTHNPVRFPKIQELLCCPGSGAHIEVCKGNAAQNMEYCKKDGDWEEYGEPPMDQKRKGEEGKAAQQAKYRKITDLAMEGKLQEISEEFPREYLVMYRTLKTIRMDSIRSTKTIQGELEHEWLYGPSGAGKSSRARRENPGIYDKDVDHDSAKWWDMYEGESAVLIEDLSPFNRSMTDALKKWSDRYPFKAQVKGAYMQIRPQKIVVTSQYRIDEIWEDEKTRAAMHRRFTEIEVDPEEEEEERKQEKEKEEECSVTDLDEEL